MAKLDTMGIATLAAVGIVGFGLLKSDFFKGLGKVGSGVGDAVGGLGSGISDVAGDVSQVTGNIADFTNPLGALGSGVANNMEQISELKMYLRDREFQQANVVDVGAFDQTQEQLTNIQAGQDIYSAEQGALRSKDWEGTKTNVQDNLTDWVEGASKIPTYNPFGTISRWVTSKVRSLKAPSIIGNVVSPGSGGVSSNQTSQTQSSSLKSSSSSSAGSTFMENLGYSGQSTAEGVKWTKNPVSTPFGSFTPKQSIRAPKKKTWWNPFD